MAGLGPPNRQARILSGGPILQVVAVENCVKVGRSSCFFFVSQESLSDLKPWHILG